MNNRSGRRRTYRRRDGTYEAASLLLQAAQNPLEENDIINMLDDFATDRIVLRHTDVVTVISELEQNAAREMRGNTSNGNLASYLSEDIAALRNYPYKTSYF